MKSKEEKQFEAIKELDQHLPCNQSQRTAVLKLPYRASLNELQKLSPTALAYLGDAVYELYIRMYYLLPPQRLNSYHRSVVEQVRAEMQANHLQALAPHLTEIELEIVRRGRNAATRRPKRVPAETYQQATSLETLIGYLYLTDEARLIELLHKLNLKSDLGLNH
ncbi:MAG: ribonuclease III [Calothrix sp. C42_A2020_038]|nr:ribonuclease III [Calothrix sp. C42_A2020_038]